MTTLHGLQAGTDGGSPLLRWAMFGATAAVVALTALRVAQALAPPVTRSVHPTPSRAGTAARCVSAAVASAVAATATATAVAGDRPGSR